MANPDGIPSRYDSADLSTDVVLAITRLQELGEQMKDKLFNFTPKELQQIDDLMYYLKDLDSKRHKTHELLEAETIKTSIVRRRLENFPQKLAIEVEEKVKRARESNDEQISGLKRHVGEVAGRILKSKREQEALKLHNRMLEQEEQRLSEEHSKLVTRLNECMLGKTDVQIELNETREKFKQTLDRVNAIKREIREVEEGMEVVMKKFAGDMSSLCRMVDGIRSEQVHMTDYGENLKRLLASKRKSVGSKEVALQKKTAEAAKLESSVKILLDTKEKTSDGIKQLEKEIEDLKEQCAALGRDAEQVRAEYGEKEKAVQEKRDHLKMQLDLLTGEMDKLTQISKGVKKDLKLVTDDADMQQSVLDDIKQRVEESKKSLLHQSEEGARLLQEYEVLVQKLNDLKISHQEALQLHYDEIATLQQQLEEDIKTTEVVQSGYEELTATVKAKRVGHKETMMTLQNRVTEGKKTVVELTDQLEELKESTKETSEKLDNAQVKLQKSETKLEQRKKFLANAVKVLEESVADLSEEIGDRDETLATIIPQSMSMEIDHGEIAEDYDSKKKELIALKSEKTQVQDRIKELSRSLEKIHIPRQKLQMDTLRCRAYTRQRVIQYTKEVDRLEKQVMEATQKLSAVSKENKRIVETSEFLSQEIARMKNLLLCSKEMEDQLDSALRIYKDKLSAQWSRNDDLEKSSAVRDSHILQDITKLREASETRHQVISSLHEQFETEVKGFSDYLSVTAQQSKTD